AVRTSAMPASLASAGSRERCSIPRRGGSRITSLGTGSAIPQRVQRFACENPRMTRPWSPRSNDGSPRWSRRLAALTAFVVGAGRVGIVATEAGAQTSGGGLDVGSIQSTVDPAVAIVNTTLAGGQGQAAGTGLLAESPAAILTN